MIHVALLAFMICPIGWIDDYACVDGRTVARSCTYAGDWVRQGLRPGFTLVVLRCTEN